jgi:hypothetical protein
MPVSSVLLVLLLMLGIFYIEQNLFEKGRAYNIYSFYKKYIFWKFIKGNIKLNQLREIKTNHIIEDGF